LTVLKKIFRGILQIYLYNSLDGGGEPVDEKIIELIRSSKDKGLMLMQQQYSGLMHYIVGGILQNESDIEECIISAADIPNRCRAWNDRTFYRRKTIPPAKKAAEDIRR